MPLVETEITATTPDEFNTWLKFSKARRCKYFHDALRKSKTRGKHNNYEILLDAAYKAASDRKVYLFQRKDATGLAYIAVKAENQVPISLAPLPYTRAKPEQEKPTEQPVHHAFKD